jgi:predicted nucleotidyltransferase
MRLELHEIGAIKRGAERHFGSNCAGACSVRGPTIDGCGGDIDLHVQVDDDSRSTMVCRVRFLADLEEVLGERRVDLIVEGPGRKNGYIDWVAVETGVLL